MHILKRRIVVAVWAENEAFCASAKVQQIKIIQRTLHILECLDSSIARHTISFIANGTD